ncbi:Integrin beta-PS [Hypsibius exemplaris]|uniref:Integrin beta n=1 Tax=Hypsibius exemplaris TaxID=2072580 RepID=A0A1W0WE63_HYPEX|nr:Integrin beta-PS [Hypsibius exemplaris]
MCVTDKRRWNHLLFNAESVYTPATAECPLARMLGMRLADMDRKWSTHLSLLICSLSAIFATALAQTSSSAVLVEELISNPCVVHQNCDVCIQANPNCAWCTQEKYGDETNAPRCDLVANLANRKCEYRNIINPESKLIIERDEELSSTVQFAPQQIRIKLRPRKSYPIPVRFRQAKDYPVDLYYLMDLSHSMLDDKIKLATLGRYLADEMRNLTSNFQLGFGSFVDKVVMPFVSTVPKKLIAPCDGCAAPYGYKHHMTLSEDTDQFTGRVNDARISGNLDAPEGSFDAIMQSIACRNDVGWRDKARKLLVLSTDASFHSAGDGKLGGIVTPNDGECHLALQDGEMQYSESTTQDYPSLSQINRAVKENKINLIFAVTEDQFPTYDRVSNYIEGSIAGKLANDSSNIVELVKDQYNKISSSIELKDNAPTDIVKITYFSKCLGSKTERTNICPGLKVGSEIQWELNVEVDKCPPGPGPHIIPFKVYPVGLDEELTVTLEILCDCDCGIPIPNAMQCSYNGTYECGICTCPPGTFGKFCECSTDSITGLDEEAGCRQGNSSLICSGRGRCVCGQCQCFPRPNSDENVYGKYCECDNFSCDRVNGILCGGPTQGSCECGNCVCKPGWTGTDCGCSESTESCMAKNGKICNGKGKCVCGKCVCDVEATPDAPAYYGATCENCPTCPGLCYALKSCAQCQAFGTGELSSDEDPSLCARNCTLFNATHVDELYEDQPGEKICQFRDESDFCTFFFSYYDHPRDGSVQVEVKKTKVCPEIVNAWALILGIILAILAVGVALLLIWKLLTLIHDRKQLAKFNAEVENARWDTSGNPIFRPATNTYKNPVYGSNK